MPGRRHALFVYGTLIDPQTQERVFGRCVQGKADRLPGYRVSTVHIGGVTYPDLKPDLNAEAEGLLLHVSDEELQRADAYEGREYRRVYLRLWSGRMAWVYLT